MCSICHMTICPAGCPNAVQKPVHVCSGCDRDIFEGERIWRIMGEIFCEDCIDDAEEEAVYDPY